MQLPMWTSYIARSIHGYVATSVLVLWSVNLVDNNNGYLNGITESFRLEKTHKFIKSNH